VIERVSVVIAPQRRVQKPVLLGFALKVVDKRLDVIGVGKHEHVARKFDKVNFRAVALRPDDIIVDFREKPVKVGFGIRRRRVGVPVDIRQLKNVEVVVILDGEDVLFEVVCVLFSRRTTDETKRRYHRQRKT